ncbi:DUF1036 domain-containing protein [Pseudahrensia aquimaris]|uniref:DUF1036 domain-containing protein n=1 Tax=Pseudahrensia aquimaris TaxID=744461 RepID=A0ABW3FCT4_9HYPH
MKKTWLAAAALLAATAAQTAPALADLKVCNDTKSMTGVAIGYRNTDGWVMEGWWRVPSGVCATVIEGALSSRYFYIYAENADTGGQWRGPVFMCTSAREFRIEGLKDCFARGYERTGFFEIDTGNQANWQVRLTEANQSGTDEKAQQ